MTAVGRFRARHRETGLREPRLRSAIRLALLFYSCTLIVYVASGFLAGGYDPRDIYRVGIPMAIIDGLLAFQLFFVLRWTWRWPRSRAIPALGLALVAIAAIQAVLDTQLRIQGGAVADGFDAAYAAFIRSATINVYHTGLFLALIAFQASNLGLRHKHRQLIASRESEREAHLLALRFQLNPHFLFNTLNAISSLVVVGRAAEAEAMIHRLSSFLRTTLTADPHSLVEVEEEFHILETYLDIESVRFGERLIVAVDLPPALSNARVPPFLLQPLVENAIKYAVAPSSRAITVRIAAAERGGQLLLTVEDDGEGCGEVGPGTGVGLANVRERLRLNYGTAARLEIRHGDCGCRAEILVPLERNGVADAEHRAVVFA